jgi:hypothetical protein
MTKNRATPKNTTTQLTSQGVRDLNQLGPRKPRQPNPTLHEVMLNERSRGLGAGFERPLHEAPRPY